MERKHTPYKDRLELAQVATLPGEELKEENFNGVNTEGFEKAVVLLKHWAEMTLKEMQKQKSFRIEIKYNAEARKTDFCIYTPIEHGSSDTQPEY